MTLSKITTSIRSCKNLLLGTALLTGSLGLIPSNASAVPASVTPGDFDGDGLSDIIVTRPTLAGDTHKLWLARFSSGAPHEPAIFGLSSDKEFTADFDGDGVTNIGVTRIVPTNGLNLVYWYYLSNTGQIVEKQFGLEGDTFFVEGDRYDQTATFIAIRKLHGGLTWIVANPAVQEPNVFNFGLENDTPFLTNMSYPAYKNPIVARNNEIPGFKSWFLMDATPKNSNAPVVESFIFGLSTDTALPPVDYNGDGVDDLVVARTEGNFVTIYVRITPAVRASLVEPQIVSFQFGLKDDVIVPGFHFDDEKANFIAFRRAASNAQAVSYLTLPGDSAHFPSAVPFGLSNDTFISPLGTPFKATIVPAPAPVQSGSGCVATPGTKTRFGGDGDLWKPHSESNGNPAVLMSRAYGSADLVVLGRDGNVVGRPQRTHCCSHNGGRKHWWLDTRASTMARSAPLTLKITRGATTECRAIPNPHTRYE